MRKRGWYNFQSWDDCFRYHRAKGEDLGYCAWMADQWEKRNRK